MMNRIVLVGRLTRDPELRKSANDVSVATFTIAVDDYSQKDANGQKSTTFLNVVVFRQSADNVQKFCRKGSLVGVDGKIRQRNFTKKMVVMALSTKSSQILFNSLNQKDQEQQKILVILQMKLLLQKQKAKISTQLM